MKIIVTGANGFIGSYLCNFLLNEGCEVVAVSRKFFPNIKNKLKAATLIEADILSEDFLKLNVDADALVHLAASNDIISKNLAKGIELSTVGTFNTLSFAKANRIKNYIFYSTLQVYGTELEGAYSESTPTKPENDYAMNHVFGELYAEMFSRKFGLNVVVARPSNIYGSFLTAEIDRWTLVPGCFCKEAIEKGTITLMSSGRQNRNFISLEQLSYTTLQTLKSMDKRFEIINYISNDFHTIVDVAHKTKEIFKNEFGKDIIINIGSDAPVRKNEFSFDKSKLDEYGIDASKKINTHNLETEISKIIKGLIS